VSRTHIIATELGRAGVPSAEHDARVLAAHAAATGADLDELVRRRAARMPLQHITGVAGFRYLDLAVGSGVFVPRPETEVVAGVALDLARASGSAPVVVDLCSGSGAIALSVAHELPTATVHAVESDPIALEWLHRNAATRQSAGDPAVVVHGVDLRDTPPTLDGTADVVVANPPYLREDELSALEPEVAQYDPPAALFSGNDGLADIRAVAQTALRLLRPGGWLVVEHSDQQGESAPAVLRAAGFAEVSDGRDLTGRDRYAIGRRA
jgi:release factor glutamine methyltransferase